MRGGDERSGSLFSHVDLFLPSAAKSCPCLSFGKHPTLFSNRRDPYCRAGLFLPKSKLAVIKEALSQGETRIQRQ